MKQKKYFILAAAALLMAACSENDIAEKQSPQVTAEDGAVVFDVYTSRSTTRAGVPGEITTNGLKTPGSELGDAGFGVFAYYTNNGEYDNLQIPNFMYNEQVTYNGSAWIYTPVKYWPNEYGNTADSEDADKVSFFAYAPWVDVVSTSGKPDAATPGEAAELQKWGINSISRNSATGDPIVKYLVDFDPAHSVDLCWGVNEGSTWNKVVDGKEQTFSAGLPWLNVQRPADAVSQKLKFTFKHALSKLNVQIDAFVDGINNTNEIAAGTRVYVRSITFEGLATKGALNLNNETKNVAKWMDYNGTNDLVTGEAVTIYDGRKDGKEGTLGGEATNEKVLGLNPDIVQTTTWKTPSETGVTNVPVNLFRKWKEPVGTDPGKYIAAGLNEPVYVIPTGDPVKVTIVYDIETEDGGLATYVSDGQTAGSSIENVISKTITFGEKTKLENGKAYTLKLHLGMNSVKFDASVTDWEIQAANDIDLPANVPAYAVSTTPHVISVPADAATYSYAITGLKPETALIISSASDNINSITATSTKSNASGIAIITVDLKENKLVTSHPLPDITCSDGTNTATIKITQNPHVLGLSASAFALGTRTITLATTGTVNWSSDIVNSEDFIVTRNGITLSRTGDYDYGTSDGTITLTATQELGDVFTITVKAGEAAAETINVRFGGLAYATNAITKYIGDEFINPLTQYGNLGGLTYNSDNTSVATVDTDGKVTALAEGTANIKASYSAGTGDGWFYHGNWNNKSYELTVVKKPATISFPIQSVTVSNVTTSADITQSQTAILKDKEGHDITSEGAAKIGTVTYSFDPATTDFTINSGTGAVSAKTGTAAGNYALTIKATVSAEGSDYKCAENTATYTMIVNVTATVAAAP